jgi:hypothetical protein
MAQVITIAGERLFALKAQNNEQLDVDTFIFANVPGQDPNATIDRNEGLPPVGQIVHQQIVQQVGRVNDNVVIYSTVLDSLTGPFDFNWVGLYSSVNQTLIAVSHIPSVSKTITVPGAAGNTLNRNFGIEYSGIADLTGITVNPETWQLDFTARLSGMDELTRQLAADMNGKDWFIGDGFKVVPRSTANTFKVMPGAGYVSGLRVELAADHILTLSSYPRFVYVDAWFDGTSESVWKGHTVFTVTDTEMDDYIDVNGRNHFLYKLATINGVSSIENHRKEKRTVNLADYSSLKDAIKAISESGGTVYVPTGKHYAGEWSYNNDYMDKANVSIIGEKMPVWNDDASELIEGSIIEGRFNAFADNFSIEKVGFDMGKNVVARRYGGESTLINNYPYGGGTWDAFAFAQPNFVTPLRQRKSFYAKDVIGLCKYPSTLGHAFLSEGYDGGYIDNVIGIYSVHACVIKSQNVRVGSIQGYLSSGEGLIIKTDTYTDCGKIQIDSVYTSNVLHNCVPHELPQFSKHGVLFLSNLVPFTGPIQVSKIISLGATDGVEFIGGAGVGGTDIQIGLLLTDGFTGSMDRGLSIGRAGDFRRIEIGEFICNNAIDGFYCSHSSANYDESQVTIANMAVQNISGSALTVDNHAEINIGNITGDNVATLYKYVGVNSRITVGTENVNRVTAKFNPPVELSNGWVNYGGANDVFSVKLANGRVEMSGLIKATNPLTDKITSLIPNLMPQSDKRFLAYKNDGVRNFSLVNVDKINGVGIDDGTVPILDTYISLDAVSWSAN